MKKIVVLGLNNRDYHYSNVTKFIENGTYIIIIFNLAQNPKKQVIAKHPIKQISGWIEDKEVK